MKYLILLFASVLSAGAADILPPCCFTNSPPSGTNSNYSRMPPTRIVRHGVHVLFDWNRATNAVNLQPPVISVVLTNNQAEWSTNMIGSTNIWTHGEIYGYGLWVFCIWFDPNCYSRDLQFTTEDLGHPIWLSNFSSNSNPRFPEYLSTLTHIPGIPPDTHKMYFRLKRRDLGLQ